MSTTSRGGGLAIGFLLLSSFAALYNFAWMYFRQRLFAHHSFAAPRGESGGGTLSLAAAGRAFSITFALSSCIFELIILEVAGLLDPAPSSLLWKTCLSLMVVGLHLVLPFLLAYACLGEIGLGRRTSCVGALVVMSLVLAFAWKYHEGGVFLDGGDRGRDFSGEGEEDYDGAYQRLPSLLSLEAGLARVGVVGVSSLALLSGFSAVNLPYQQIATLFRKVPPSLVRSRERRARLTLADIGQRKRRAAITRAANVARWNGGGAGSDWWKRKPQGLVERVVGMFSFSAGSGGGEAAHALEEAKTSSLEQLARELFLEIADCRRIQEQQRRARTLPGRLVVAFGALMFVYGLLRMWKAATSVYRSSFYYYSPAGNVVGAAAAAATGGGVGDDPATRLVRFALSRHLLDDPDAADGWSEVISFVLIGVLVLLQTRGLLVTLHTMSKASITSGVSVPAQVLSLLLSMLMGTYFTSSVILLRVNLPPRHRVAITAVLGGMRFSFYQMWFNTFFLLSGCTTAVALLVFHLANRSSDADIAEITHHVAQD